jgi:hypothetical protein
VILICKLRTAAADLFLVKYFDTFIWRNELNSQRDSFLRIRRMMVKHKGRDE